MTSPRHTRERLTDVKIALADRQPQLAGVGWVLGPGGEGPRPAAKVRDPILTVIVKDAARRLDQSDQLMIVDATRRSDGNADALMWVFGTVDPDGLLPLWPGVPAAAVFQGDTVPIVDGADVLDLSHKGHRAATITVFRWLSSASIFVSIAELRMLHVLLSDLHALLKPQVAASLPLLNSMQAIEVQLTAPRKSRRALGAALEQIAASVGVVDPGATIESLPELLDLFCISPVPSTASNAATP